MSPTITINQDGTIAVDQDDGFDLDELQACGAEIGPSREQELADWMADLEAEYGLEIYESDLRYMPVDAILLHNLGFAGLADVDLAELFEDWQM
jgi:hypothetical protein